MKIPSIIPSACAVAGLNHTIFAAPGGLDPSFGNAGRVVTTLATASSAAAVAVQSDGNIVVVGSAGEDAVIARYLPTGNLDPAFNGVGIATGKFVDRGGQSSLSCLALRSNGKIVAGGTAKTWSPPNPNSFSQSFLAVQFTSTGSVDKSTTPGIGGLGPEGCHSLVIQDDGKIVFAGFVGFENSADFELARRNGDFSGDDNFGGPPGYVRTDFTAQYPFAGDDDQIKDLALQSDGKIIAAGYTGHYGDISRTYKIGLARYNTNGSLDTTFNGSGKLSTTIGVGDDRAAGIVIQPDGKILIAATSIDAGVSRIALVRYNSNGSLDIGFNNSGSVVTLVGSNCAASDLALLPDGRMVVAGTSDNNFFVARYYGNGDFEGSVTTDFGGTADEAHGMAVQGDGKIVVVGKAGNNMAMARYLPGDTAVPYGEIAVEYPAGLNVNSGALTADFGPVVTGSNKSLMFTIRNQGTGDLTPLTATKAATGTPGDFALGSLPASIPPAGSATLSMTFTPSAAGTRTATLQIGSNDANENPFVINLTGTQATALEAWRQEHFGSPYNTGPGADLNDADHDGIVNILEFATATDPLAYTPFPGTLVKKGSTLEFTYTRRNAALGEMTFVREFSENLSSPWSSVGGTVETILSDDGVLQSVKTTVPAGVNGKRFVRLRVTRL